VFKANSPFTGKVDDDGIRQDRIDTRLRTDMQVKNQIHSPADPTGASPAAGRTAVLPWQSNPTYAK